MVSSNPPSLRVVRLLRVLLPAFGVILVALVFLWPQIVTQEDHFRIGYADLRIANDELSMIQPRYVGTDLNDRPFSIRARSVRNVMPDGKEMILEAPDAEITLENGEWVMVTADSGRFHMPSQTLELVGSVRLYHDQGYTLETAKANVDLDRGLVSGRSSVSGHGPAGAIEGTGFLINNKDNSVFVRGPASMLLRHGDRPPR